MSLKYIPPGERIYGKGELASGRLPQHFFRVAIIGYYGPAGEEVPFDGLDGLIDYTEDEFARFTDATGSPVVEHEWALLDVRERTLNYDVRRAYELQHNLAEPHDFFYFTDRFLERHELLVARVARISPPEELGVLDLQDIKRDAAVRATQKYPSRGRANEPFLSDVSKPEQYSVDGDSTAILTDMEPRYHKRIPSGFR